MNRIFALALVPVLAALPACRERPDADAPGARAPESAPAPTNRVDVPAAVRQNLGITFARVERRAVARTLRSPGRFELLPSARREYHAPLGGRVELLVEQFAEVREGTPLYRLDSPGWRGLQREIAEAEASVRSAEAEQASTRPLLEAHARHRESLEASVALWSGRVEQLERIRGAGGGSASDWAQAQASLTGARAELAGVGEQTAELEARRDRAGAELRASLSRRDLLLASAATLLGVPLEELTAVDSSGEPRWRTTSVVEVCAAAPGVVETLGATNGGWVEEKSPVLSTVRPAMVRFRARGLQSDLPRLRDGLPARVAPPPGGSLGPAEALPGELAIGLTADPDHRTVDLLLTPRDGAPWARAGVSGFLEVDTEGAGREELAIPLEAVVRDGLTALIFRRDPEDPDRVIRLTADLGIDDGRWVVVKSGVREGDEVVLDGVYQLMLASSGPAERGGHFHSDGTFHEGGDE
ncbi:MAG TPA: hypothetical protein VFF69_04745 [Phycisphaerales bacterium]|nr:hypothetical protein [Phycisphaerales bacterium]